MTSKEKFAISVFILIVIIFFRAWIDSYENPPWYIIGLSHSSIIMLVVAAFNIFFKLFDIIDGEDD